MSPVRRRRLAAASLAVATLLPLGGCGTGFDAQTNQVYQPAVGANARGDVDVLNTLLVANPDGSATLSAGLQNNLDEVERLSSVSVTTFDDEPLDVRSPRIALPLEPGLLTTVGSSEGTAVFLVQGAEEGEYVKVTFTFADSAPLTIEAPVVARNSEYDDVATGS